MSPFPNNELSTKSHSSTIEPVAPRPSLSTQLAVLAFVLLPPLALLVAIVRYWDRGVWATDLAQLAFWHFLTGAGITVGFHRLFTHASFKTTRPIAAFLAILGSMAVEGPLFKWCAMHIEHHTHSDKDNDPHSPHAFGGGFWGVARGFWHSHMGWLFTYEMSPTRIRKLTARLQRDPWLVQIDRLFPLWVILGLILPAALGGLLTQSLDGALRGLLWGGLIRIGTVHHVTWSINSICHLWGRADFRSDDLSRNNWLCALVGLGEGWHNGHHAFPWSAKHGLLRGQFDLSWGIIRTLAALGWVWDVKLPTLEQIASRASRPLAGCALSFAIRPTQPTAADGEPATFAPPAFTTRPDPADASLPLATEPDPDDADAQLAVGGSRRSR